MSFLWYILIGILAGWVAGKIMRGGGFGLVVNLVVGIIRRFARRLVVGLFGLIPVGSIGSFITSVIGAIVLLWLISFMQPKQKQ